MELRTSIDLAAQFIFYEKIIKMTGKKKINMERKYTWPCRPIFIEASGLKTFIPMHHARALLPKTPQLVPTSHSPSASSGATRLLMQVPCLTPRKWRIPQVEVRPIAIRRIGVASAYKGKKKRLGFLCSHPRVCASPLLSRQRPSRSPCD